MIKQWLVKTWHKLGSPKWFYQMSSAWLPWLALLTIVLLTVGVVWGLAFAPADAKQGNSFRIIYILSSLVSRWFPLLPNSTLSDRTIAARKL